jgi:hypothetical protein
LGVVLLEDILPTLLLAGCLLWPIVALGIVMLGFTLAELGDKVFRIVAHCLL